MDGKTLAGETCDHSVRGRQRNRADPEPGRTPAFVLAFLSKTAPVAWREKTSWVSWFIGAGEGIRTLDPNLGKVVLYH